MYRHIIHIHIPAFFIAVLRTSHVELRDRPVVVAPFRSDRALVISASSEARKEGILNGMPIVKAAKRCPHLTVVPPNPELTEKASHILDRMVAQYTPLRELARPGHIYLDVTGTRRLWGRAKDTAARITGEIKTRLHLSGKVGVAGNKMVSSIASQIMPREGVLDVDHGLEGPFMAPLKVSIIPGIGPFRRKTLLEELNITRVRELAALDMGRLKLIFGREAHLIHQRARGIDPTPVCPAPFQPTVSEGITLSQDENDDAKLLRVLYRLAEKCALRLRARDLFPRKAGLLLRYADHVEARHQTRLPHPSFWDFDLYGPLESLFFKACKRRIRVRSIRILFWHFSSPSGQLSLFQDASSGQEKKSLAIQAMDRIRKRYGEGAIRSGRAA